MNCPICNHSLENYIEGRIQVLKCLNCGLGVTKGVVVHSGKYHRDETYIDEVSLFSNIFLKRVKIICKLTKPGKALEVGCSTGILLQKLRAKGWEVIGNEVSRVAAEVAKRKNIKIISEPFERAVFKEEFDLIIFNHTLEHLKDPVKVVEKVSMLLNKAGLLYIDLPNFDSLTSKILKNRWPMLLPDEHLWHFTYESLKLLLSRNGFKIIFTERASGIWDYENPLKGILMSLFNFKKRFFTEVLTAIPSWIIWKIRLGSDLMVIAKKR